MNQEKKESQGDQIDLLELVQVIIKGKKTILKYLVVFGVIGLFIAIFSEKEYKAQTVLLPQISGSNALGNLGGIAAMAGIDIGGGAVEGVSPMLYPKVVSSVPFQRALLQTPIAVEGMSDKITFETYFQKHYKPGLLAVLKKYTIGLPSVILSAIKGKKDTSVKKNLGENSIYTVSLKEKRLFKLIDSKLLVFFDEKEGVVNIDFSMPEALMAAQMTKAAQDLLQKTIIKHKTYKIKGELDFVQGRYKEVKEDFIEKQTTLAGFKDRNKGLVTLRAQTKLKRLESEYNLSFNLYTELAKQLETYKIKLKENTPVFTVIEPVSVPINKAKPRRGIIIFMSLILGAVTGIILVFIKDLRTKMFIK